MGISKKTINLILCIVALAPMACQRHLEGWDDSPELIPIILEVEKQCGEGTHKFVGIKPFQFRMFKNIKVFAVFFMHIDIPYFWVVQDIDRFFHFIFPIQNNQDQCNLCPVLPEQRLAHNINEVNSLVRQQKFDLENIDIELFVYDLSGFFTMKRTYNDEIRAFTRFSNSRPQTAYEFRDKCFVLKKIGDEYRLLVLTYSYPGGTIWDYRLRRNGEILSVNYSYEQNLFEEIK